MSKFAIETTKMAQKESESLGLRFTLEVERLMKSGAVDLEKHSRSVLFAVALENLADIYAGNSRDSEEYTNLKCF